MVALSRIFLGLMVLFVVGCGNAQLTSPSANNRAPDFSTEVGAGGSGVMCEANALHPASFEMLDVYEARKRNMAPDLGPPNLPVLEKVDIALKRLAVHSPVRATNYRVRAEEILKKAHFFENSYLPHIADSDPQNLPDGCRLVQIATRRRPLFDDDPEFLIDNRLMKLLNGDNQAVLLLHEVAYEEAVLFFGHLTSRLARGFISIFFSRAIEKMSFPDFLAFLSKADFKQTDWGALSIPTNGAERYSKMSGIVRIKDSKVAQVSWPVSANADGYVVTPQSFYYRGYQLIMGGGMVQQATFFDDKSIRSLYGHLTTPEGRLFLDRFNFIKLKVDEPSLTRFRQDGSIQMITADAGSKIRLKFQPTLHTALKKMSCLTFEPSGVVSAVDEGESCQPQMNPDDRLWFNLKDDSDPFRIKFPYDKK